MIYPSHIQRHIKALQEFVRLNSLPGIVVPARGEAQIVRPLAEPKHPLADFTCTDCNKPVPECRCLERMASK